MLGIGAQALLHRLLLTRYDTHAEAVSAVCLQSHRREIAIHVCPGSALEQVPCVQRRDDAREWLTSNISHALALTIN
jgi:hypothetical protein